MKFVVLTKKIIELSPGIRIRIMMILKRIYAVYGRV